MNRCMHLLQCAAIRDRSPAVQSTRPIPAAKTPSFQAQRREKHQSEAQDKRSRLPLPLPLPLDEEQLERVGGGYSAPKSGW